MNIKSRQNCFKITYRSCWNKGTKIKSMVMTWNCLLVVLLFAEEIIAITIDNRIHFMILHFYVHLLWIKWKFLMNLIHLINIKSLLLVSIPIDTIYCHIDNNLDEGDLYQINHCILYSKSLTPWRTVSWKVKVLIQKNLMC